MQLRPVEPGFAVSAQIQPDDVAAIADEGFATIICNRPDYEEPGQPTVNEIAAAAEAAGLAFIHIPVAGGQFPKAAIDAFYDARKSARGPVLAYCRTGTRSITLDTLANYSGLSVNDRLRRAERAGYDLSALAPALG